MKQQYNSYRPSGINWVGDIPSHWKAMPLKRQGTMNTGLTFTKADLVECGDAVVSYGQIHSSKNDKVNLTEDLVRYIPKSISNVSALVPKGSFIFADTSEDLEGCGNAAYNNSDRVLYAGYHTIILRRKNVGGKYLAYLFQTDTWRSQIRSRVSGVKVYSVTQAILATTSIILPPLAEQEAIVEWLDEKCQVIDAAIAKVDREIELIDELKQSEISRVVTRGLNPDAPLRPSGIDWIGDIPKHWEVCKVKHKYHIQTGFTPATKNHEYYDLDNGYTWITIGDIKEGTVSESSNKISSKYIEEFAPQPTPKGSLLYSFKLSVGQVSFAGADLYTNEAIASFINSENINLSFLKYSSSLIVNNANINIYGAPILNQELIKNAPIVFPPLSEQQEIADYLDKKCAEIDGLKAKLTKKRETLTELRQSIISEVVTGKRKVI